jgi:hypothetical protein
MALSDFGTLCTIAGVTGKVINVDPPQLAVGVIETTNHSSANWREYIADGLKSLAPFAVTMEVSGALITELETVLAAFAPVAVVFTEKSIPAWSFNALIPSFKINAANASSPTEEIVTVNIQPTGSVTIAAVAGNWYDDVTAFYFNTNHLAILDGNTFQLVVYAVIPGIPAHVVTPAEMADITFAYDGGGAIAIVDVLGQIEGISAGDAIITATLTADPNINAALLVTVT